MKGSYDENCNRTACQTDKRVYFYNKAMDAYYCLHCAELIAEWDDDEMLFDKQEFIDFRKNRIIPDRKY